MMVAPERETPGTIATAWQTPIASALPIGVVSTSCTVGTGRKRSISRMTMPPSTNVTPVTARALYRTRVTNPDNRPPATSAGTSATSTMAAKRRASGRDGRPITTSRIFAR